MKDITKRRIERLEAQHATPEPPIITFLPLAEGIERERAQARITEAEHDPRGSIWFCRDCDTWTP